VSNKQSHQATAPATSIVSPPRPEGVGTVRVVYGIHALSVGVAGKSVGEAREALRQAMNISPRAIALVDGQEVIEDRILLPGQHLEFVRQAGEKGAAMDERQRTS
jgi:hypothetical protein